MQLSFSEDRLINAIKTAFACFLGLLVSKYTSSGPGHQWILISIIVVMSAQTHLGGALQKSYMRIVGTLTGAIIAIISILLFSHDLLIIKGIIILSCLGYAYLAGKSANAGAACTLGAVTVTMILLNDPLNLYPAYFINFHNFGRC